MKKILKMKKIISLIIGIMAIAMVVYSFWNNSTTESIFGIETNIWIYRLFWSIIAIILLYDYYKKRNCNTDCNTDCNTE